MSARFTPAAATSMSTSPGPGFGSGSSAHVRTSGSPYRGRVMAYMLRSLGRPGVSGRPVRVGEQARGGEPQPHRGPGEAGGLQVGRRVGDRDDLDRAFDDRRGVAVPLRIGHHERQPGRPPDAAFARRAGGGRQPEGGAASQEADRRRVRPAVRADARHHGVAAAVQEGGQLRAGHPALRPPRLPGGRARLGERRLLQRDQLGALIASRPGHGLILSPAVPLRSVSVTAVIVTVTGVDGWVETRRALNAQRAALAERAADRYPGAYRIHPTPLLSRPEWVAARPVPLDRIALDWVPAPPEPVVTGAEPESTGVRGEYPTYAAALASLDPPKLLEDRPCYRLLDLEWTGGSGRMSFGPARYFQTV